MKIYLSFLWHHHQPYYRDRVTGEFWMPWVRLHGIKDYYGMAALLEEFPNIKANINLVPSLLKQITEYLPAGTPLSLRNGGWDRLLYLGRKPVADLTEEDKQYLKDNSFMAHPVQMIAACPRYKELQNKHNANGKTAVSPVTPCRYDVALMRDKFNTQDYLDLIVCSNLVWFHSTAVEKDDFLKSLKAKSRNYTESDKTVLFQKEMEILGQIIPLHRRLQESGQIEITTTPFYHPILPLLVDMSSARTAMPGIKLPQVNQPGLKEDADWQLAEAVKSYRGYFGADPKGLWPAEGSVSPGILPLLAAHGINYFATDEEILAHTLNTSFPRDNNGILNDSTTLYQPYQVDAGERKLAAVFRDQSFSNLISFQYQRWPAKDAVQHLISQIKTNASRSKHTPPLVNIILDGENPWEHYPNNGIEFLRGLYQALSDDKEIETVRLSDYLQSHPPRQTLPTIYSGSWINHNFSIWIGHNEDYQGWEYLSRTRETAQSKGLSLEDIYIAEGSDWFWWFGHEHSSPLDGLFDSLFRKHLMNIYLSAGLEVPDYLHRTIKQITPKEVYTQPWGLLDIQMDGRQSDYFEWLPAGQYIASRDTGLRSTMDQSDKPLLKSIFFGFNHTDLFFRFDILRPSGQATAQLNNISFTIKFLQPQKRMIIINGLPAAPYFSVCDENQCVIKDNLKSIAYSNILEISCPFDALSFKPGEEVELFVKVYSAQPNTPAYAEATAGRPAKSLATYPATLPIKFKLPVDGFENINWTA
ncbi:MAG: glycoside hydrolase [Planctomycetes bacterium]|nr:glycoside hydrolase [Planctomycetota bacterium]